MNDEDKEMQAVLVMLKRAERAKLLVEVVMAFGEARAEGKSVQESCASALWDWDA